MSAIVMCGRKDPRFNDPIKMPEGATATEKPCVGCGETLLLSPSSVAIPNANYYCNPCGQKAVAGLKRQPVLGIAPGALQQPGDAKRRHQLERHGFRQLTDEEVRRLSQ